jgi:hypothetical protein
MCAFGRHVLVVDLDAPAGAPLAVGTYTGAVRYPFNGFAAGLDISGDGAAATGRPLVHRPQLVIGTTDRVVRFAATSSSTVRTVIRAVRRDSLQLHDRVIVPFDGAIRIRRDIPIPAHGTIAEPACLRARRRGPARQPRRAVKPDDDRRHQIRLRLPRVERQLRGGPTITCG